MIYKPRISYTISHSLIDNLVRLNIQLSTLNTFYVGGGSLSPVNSNDKGFVGCSDQNNGFKTESNNYPRKIEECFEASCHTPNADNFEILLEQLKNAQEDAQVCQFLEDLVILLGNHKVY